MTKSKDKWIYDTWGRIFATGYLMAAAIILFDGWPRWSSIVLSALFLLATLAATFDVVGFPHADDVIISLVLLGITIIYALLMGGFVVVPIYIFGVVARYIWKGWKPNRT